METAKQHNDKLTGEIIPMVIDSKTKRSIPTKYLICPDCGKPKSPIMPSCDNCLGKHIRPHITDEDCQSCREKIRQEERQKCFIDACEEFYKEGLASWKAQSLKQKWFGDK